jgi:hypothetical protein
LRIGAHAAVSLDFLVLLCLLRAGESRCGENMIVII